MNKKYLNRYSIRTSNLIYRQTEEWLRSYTFDKREIENRKEYLRGMQLRSSSDFQALALLGCHVDGGTDINTLERILDMIEDDHMIRRLTARTKAIEDFLKELDDESYIIVDLRYLKRQGLQNVSDQTHLSIDTLRKRRIPRLIEQAARYLFGDKT